MAILGSFSAVRAQSPQSAVFKLAFSYVEELLRPDSPARARLRGIAVGTSQRIELGEGVFAMEQVYATKARPDGIFESHRKYIDVQVIVEGEEVMEVIDASRVQVKEPYNAEKDYLLYQDAPGASQLRVGPGDTAVFFPVDVHMPSLRPAAAAGTVRKTVVKVPVA